jgi:hypothetical protein
MVDIEAIKKELIEGLNSEFFYIYTINYIPTICLSYSWVTVFNNPNDAVPFWGMSLIIFILGWVAYFIVNIKNNKLNINYKPKPISMLIFFTLGCASLMSLYAASGMTINISLENYYGLNKNAMQLIATAYAMMSVIMFLVATLISMELKVYSKNKSEVVNQDTFGTSSY